MPDCWQPTKEPGMIILLILSRNHDSFGNLSFVLLCPLPSRLLQKTLRVTKEVMKELGQVLMDFSARHTSLIISASSSFTVCRRICDEDCAAVPESRPGDGRIGTQWKRKSDFIMVRTELRPLCWVLCWQDIILPSGLKKRFSRCAVFSTFLLWCMPCLLTSSRKVVG